MGAGRPKKWNSPKAMEKKIEEYFEKCEGTPLIGDDGKIEINKRTGEPIYLFRKPPTVTGLTLYLGFAATQSLFDYAEKEEYSAIISRAKLRIESYLEERLMDREGQRGAEFNLRCNFKWTDKESVQQEETNAGVILIAPVKEITEPREEEKDV